MLTDIEVSHSSDSTRDLLESMRQLEEESEKMMERDREQTASYRQLVRTLPMEQITNKSQHELRMDVSSFAERFPELAATCGGTDGLLSALNDFSTLYSEVA
ncbi:hypothetical protein [Thalassospira xiamenensis]|uniref:Uncharacterized protein n=1 Tax=Thalassospira xiamenensis TaxID=220697 RepID=A0A285TUD7_9PROT|nr:hypothetical protein [Thalassospira xiamenensis]SOC27488.1 hypothetical protein SAMN05428964_105436 [Thalassospira xiamenensis]